MAQYLVGSNVDSGYGHLDGSGEVTPLSYPQIHLLVCLWVGESKAVVLESPKKFVNPVTQKSTKI